MFPITCNAVGDIVTLASLVLDLVQALREARGSPSEYRTLAAELNSMHTMLVAVSRVASGSEDGALREEIVREVDRCALNIQNALDRIAKFALLGNTTTRDRLRVRFARQWYKLEWRCVRQDDAQAVRAELQAATQRLTALLVLSNADGAQRFRSLLSGLFRDMAARHSELSEIISANSAILGELQVASRRKHALVQRLFADIPDGVDSRTVAVAVLFVAVCTMHETHRSVHMALLLAVICILLRATRQQGVAGTIGYSEVNSVTLHDALGRRLVLPFELCGTYAIFDATLWNLFSTLTKGRWFIESRRYRIKLADTKTVLGGIVKPTKWARSVTPGSHLVMDVVVQRKNDPKISCPEGSQCYPVYQCDLPGDGFQCLRCGRVISGTLIVKFPHHEGEAFPSTSGWNISRDDVDEGALGCIDHEEDQGRYSSARQIVSSRVAPTSLTHHFPEPSQLEQTGAVIGPRHRPSDFGVDQLIQNDCWETHLRMFRRIYNPTAFEPGRNRARASCGIASELRVAAEGGHCALLMDALDRGADINERDRQGYTALHFASFNGYVDIVRLLLDRGAAANVETRSGLTPYACATWHQRGAVQALLLERGGLMDISTLAQAVVLEVAVQTNDANAAEVVLHLGMDVNMAVSPYYQTALHAAARTEDVRIIEMLLRYGADVNVVSGVGQTPLSTASYFQNVEIAQLLLDHHARIDAEIWPPEELERQRFWTVLHTAVWEGSADTVELLLKNGANVNARTEHGQTLLFVMSEKHRRIQLDIESKDWWRRYFGFWIKPKYEEVLKILRAWGAVQDAASPALVYKPGYAHLLNRRAKLEGHL